MLWTPGTIWLQLDRITSETEPQRTQIDTIPWSSDPFVRSAIRPQSTMSRVESTIDPRLCSETNNHAQKCPCMLAERSNETMANLCGSKPNLWTLRDRMSLMCPSLILGSDGINHCNAAHFWSHSANCREGCLFQATGAEVVVEIGRTIPMYELRI